MNIRNSRPGTLRNLVPGMSRLAFLRAGACAVFGLMMGAVSASEMTREKVPVYATAAIRASLEAAETVFVYEGLPHPSGESDLLKTEMKRKDLTMIYGFPFYDPKVKAKPKLAKSLQGIVGSAASIETFGGEKLCGGFHPDYALAWKHGDSTRFALVCYGCNEIIFVAGENAYRYEFNARAIATAKTAFAQFAAKRPVK